MGNEGKALGRVPLVGEAVENGNARVGGEFLHRLLRGSAVFDRVEHPSEYARGIPDALFETEMRRLRIEERRMRALVVRRHFEGRSRARGRFFENEGDVFPLQALSFLAQALGFLEFDRKADEMVDLLGRMVHERKKTAVLEADGHEKAPSTERGSRTK